MSKWRLETHIVGKAYDLTQENMNAMIADIERLRPLVGVLNFYGNSDNYIEWSAQYGSMSLQDGGKRAREALAEVLGEGNLE